MAKKRRILLINVKSSRRGAINKDLAGGFGTATIIGNSWRAKLLEYAKKRTVKLPLMAAGYLAAIFKMAGWETEFFEFSGDDFKDVHDFELVFIPASIVDYKNEISAARKMVRGRETRIGFYGAMATVLPDLFLPYADLVIQGEPEEIAFKIANSEIIPQGILVSKPIINLDSLPFPDWDTFPVNLYSYTPSLDARPFLNILSSRGCPYSCSFYCPYTRIEGTHWRARTVENVISEVEYLKERYKIKGLGFRDPNFTINRERTINIAKELIGRRIKVEWSCETRIDLLDRELIEILFESGLRNINIGIESAEPDILKDARRTPAGLEKQEEIIDFCSRKGVNIAAFYILGLPSDIPQTIRRTIDYAKKLNTNIAQFTICTPYPGTAFYESIKDKIFERDFEKFDGYTSVFYHPNLTPEELLRWKEKAFLEYYFRPKWIFNYLKRKVKFFFKRIFLR